MGPAEGSGRRARPVEATDGRSALSKASLHAHGYVRDPFAALLGRGRARRAPLVHRGYHVRARAVRHCVRLFLERARGAAQAPQLLSLGAGSDSLYFRLRASGRLGRAAVWEVDLPPVARGKVATIRATPELAALVGPWEPEPLHPASCLDGPAYHVLGLDLRDPPGLQRALDATGLRPSAPTLLLAEAVLAYLEPPAAEALLAWAAGRFPAALFAAYEPLRPADPFGRVMRDHFRRRGAALLGPAAWPDLEAQRRRFLRAGWAACGGADMNDFFRAHLPEAERRRVRALEPFDEFEEWHLKCAHYCVVVAASGPALGPPPFLPGPGPPEPDPPAGPALPAHPAAGLAEGPGLRRYGHASAPLGPDIILSSGGFGERDGRHGRLAGLHVLRRRPGGGWRAAWAGGPAGDGRLFHTLSPLPGSRVLLLGGRRSPLAPVPEMECWALSPGGPEDEGPRAEAAGPGPAPPDRRLRRWRHTATEVTWRGRACLFVYGGRSDVEPALGDWAFLRVDGLDWAEVPVEGPAPAPRHSHAACGWRGGALVAGGLGADEEPLGSVLFLRPTPSGFRWEPLDVRPPLFPRYSHTAHVLDDRLLLLVGGVRIPSSFSSPAPVPGVAVIDLATGRGSEHPIDAAAVPWPLMLHNHTSVLLEEERRLLLLGGGGTCFSFGTHLNPQPVTLDLAGLAGGAGLAGSAGRPGRIAGPRGWGVGTGEASAVLKSGEPATGVRDAAALSAELRNQSPGAEEDPSDRPGSRRQPRRSRA
ncbi:tRNA wybutosine-synthesizing protein 4 [Tachyglossus aculeatus]|uniref:tRNA wybutosine-synthesizing protein 4 n=1 Tax=Tachyglossus aculeatus TaxID=9261 RepID=UPI0018F46321|nr:tRNA wybutosine-synthesizing protein 4 [Tachyglossus aculeatus]